MKTMRKGAVVKYKAEKEDFNRAFGYYFKVYRNEVNFLKLVSLRKPEFGVVATVPCSSCRLVNK